MPLAPLADTADLPAAWQNNADAAKALDIASAAIRDAAGNLIGPQQTSSVVVDGGLANMLPLPGPIASVDSVSVEGVARDADRFTVTPYGLWSRCGWGDGPVPVAVTYTYGLAEVPADIVDMCVQLAVAWLQHQAEGGGSTAGLSAVRIDDAAENYTDEAAGQISPVFIPQVTRNWLRARFGGGATVVEASL